MHGTDAHGGSEEDGSRIFIMTSSFIYKEMREDIANDHYESDIAEGKKLIRELAKTRTDYSFDLATTEW